LAKKFNAYLVACYELTEIAKRKGFPNVFPLNTSGSVRIDDVTITAVPALHSSGFKEGENYIYGGVALGYVVAEDGAPAFYDAGDTGVFSDMSLISELYSPQIALLPIGGTYTMKPMEAAIAVRNLQVRTVVPMHFGTFPALAGTADELKLELKRRGIPTVVFVLKPGQEVSLKELGSAR
jgi:L-ascorbate metabolism protein UlaG (beta-lactamase superfamily)